MFFIHRSRVDKINAEVVTLTYGTIVSQLCRDLILPNTANKTDYNAVNVELDKMGFNIGLRLIEDFLARSNTGQCTNFRETAEMISKVGFKIFMNITPSVTNWSQDARVFHLVLEENPLADFVELPDDGRAQDELWYSNILSGVIRGALEMVGAQLVYLRKLHSQTDNNCRCKCRSKHNLSAMCCAAMTRLRCELRSYGISRTRCLLTTNEPYRDVLCLHVI